MKRLSLLVLCIIFSFVGFGQIIYHDFVPNIYLEVNINGITDQSFYLDLNKDSIIDFRLELRCYYNQMGTVTKQSHLEPFYNQHKVAIQPESCNVKSFIAGDQIWNNLVWEGGPPWHNLFLNTMGFWCNNFSEYKYAALRFEINGANHFGWVRLKGSHGSTGKLYIADCAFNSTPEAGIIAGDTVTSLIVSDGEDKINRELKIYPNPVHNILTIEHAANYYNLSISNVFGKLVYEKKTLQQTERINCENLSPGIYFIRLQNVEELITRKIIIQ